MSDEAALLPEDYEPRSDSVLHAVVEQHSREMTALRLRCETEAAGRAESDASREKAEAAATDLRQHLLTAHEMIHSFKSRVSALEQSASSTELGVDQIEGDLSLVRGTISEVFRNLRMECDQAKAELHEAREAAAQARCRGSCCARACAVLAIRASLCTP